MLLCNVRLRAFGRYLAPFLLLYSSLGVATTQDEYRELFKQARQALVLGKRDESRALTEQLQGYVLYPYAQYQLLQAELSSPSKSTDIIKLDEIVEKWLAENQDLPSSRSLHKEWLRKLARQNQWLAYRRAYELRPFESSAYQCHYARALLESEQFTSARQVGSELWLYGRSRPKVCDAIFGWLDAQNFVSEKMVWERIELAFLEGQPNLALFLSKRLPEGSKERVETWYRAYQTPETDFLMLLNQTEPLPLFVAKASMRRLARRDVKLAVDVWPYVQASSDFTVEGANEMQRYIAVRAARARHENARYMLATLPLDVANEDTREWRMRLNLEQQDWAGILSTYVSMPSEEQSIPSWRYWVARSLEKLGHTSRAAQTFASLIEGHGYYALMSADRVGQEYAFAEVEPTPVYDAVVQQQLMTRPEFVRAHELFLLRLNWMARAEWRQGTKDLTAGEALQAGLIADKWGWHSQAIRSLAKAQDETALSVLFPTPYKEFVIARSSQRQLSADWVWGLMRSESLFMPDVRSSAGAIGLMQIMPATGKDIAQLLGHKWRGASVLSNPETNIEFGTQYLRMMLDRFDNNLPAATAAYNAGPHRVQRWLPNAEGMPTDVWIDVIPFKETRHYVRRVMSHTVAFNNSRGDKQGRLAEWLQPMPIVPSR